jgi:hypothetical protein
VLEARLLQAEGLAARASADLDRFEHPASLRRLRSAAKHRRTTRRA